MSFVGIALVLFAIAAAEAAPREPLGDVTGRCASVCGGALALSLLAFALTSRFRDGWRQREHRAECWQQLQRGRKLLLALGGLYAVVAMFVVSWPQVVRVEWGLAHGWLIDEVLIFLPLLLPIVSWCAAYFDVEVALAKLGVVETNARTRGAFVVGALRESLAVELLPAALVLAVQDTIDLLPESSALRPWTAGLHAASLVGLMFAYPALLRRLWPTRPLPDGPLRARLEAAARRAGVRVRHLLVWHAGQDTLNAAVIGLFPGQRVVLLSDALLTRLHEDEVEAAFLHELAHVARRHLWWRLATLLPLAIVWGLSQTVWREPLDAAGSWLASHQVSAVWQAAILIPCAVLLYIAPIMGWLSRACEYDADRWACRLASGDGRLGVPNEETVACFVRMLAKLAIFGGVDPRRREWLHPSLDQRVRSLRRSLTREKRDAATTRTLLAGEC